MLSLQSNGRQPQPQQQQQQQAVTPPMPLPPVAFGSVTGSGGLGFSSALFRIASEFDESPAFSLQTVDSSVDVKPSMQMMKPIEGLMSISFGSCIYFCC